MNLFMLNITTKHALHTSWNVFIRSRCDPVPVTYIQVSLRHDLLYECWANSLVWLMWHMLSGLYWLCSCCLSPFTSPCLRSWPSARPPAPYVIGTNPIEHRFLLRGGRRGQDPEHKESQPPQPLWPPTTWSATLIYKWVTFATTAFAQGQLKICVLKGGLTKGEVLIMKGSLRGRLGLHMGTLRELVHDPDWGKIIVIYSWAQPKVPEGALLQVIEVLLTIFH